MIARHAADYADRVMRGQVLAELDDAEYVQAVAQARGWRQPGQGGDDRRVVAQRHVEEGDTVAANSPSFTIVELDPMTAVIHLTGRDYGRLESGQPVTLKTDANPGETFVGEVSRVAPVFQQASRQARAELTVANPQHRLKPGMFVRAEAVLERVEDATHCQR